ncbi:hypothetical protein ES708_02163 [subsurface metagenome]
MAVRALRPGNKYWDYGGIGHTGDQSADAAFKRANFAGFAPGSFRKYNEVITACYSLFQFFKRIFMCEMPSPRYENRLKEKVHEGVQ